MAPTLRVPKLFLLVLVATATSGLSSSGDFYQKYAELHQQAMAEHLIPMPITRPANCPAISVAFADISEQMSDLALSLTDGLCYEKHSRTIAELARLNGTINPEVVKDLPPPENGALVDVLPGQVINITNNQMQNVKNQNSLITGFFNLTKEKSCIESFKRRSRLSAVAGTLAKIGTLSLFLPSQLGLGGSTASFLLGGSLLALDKILQPKFTWNYQKDRRDFMAMTCAFYHLRSNLYYAGFFDVATPEDPQRLSHAETLDTNLKKLSSSTSTYLNEWGESWNKKLKSLITSHNQQDNIRLCQLIKEATSLLNSPIAQGLSVEERLTVQSYLSRQLGPMTTVLGELPQPYPEATKAIAIMNSMDKLSHEDILTLGRKNWQLAHMQSLLFHLDAINKQQCGNIERVVNDFNERHDFDPQLKNSTFNEQKVMTVHQLLGKIGTLRHDLSWSAQSIKRLSLKRSLSQFDDGAMNQFDILTEYQTITDKLLGKKGWSFVSYLLTQAQDNINDFIKHFGRWTYERETNVPTKMLCRDSFVVEKYFDLADSAVEYAYDFLMATDELWSSVDKRRHGFGRIMPLFQSTSMELSSANQSMQLAKSVLTAQPAYSERDLEAITTQISHETGKVVLLVKGQTKNRQVLNAFSKANCYNITP